MGVDGERSGTVERKATASYRVDPCTALHQPAERIKMNSDRIEPAFRCSVSDRTDQLFGPTLADKPGE